MRRIKKWLALMLAVCIAVPTTAGTMYPGMRTVQAAEAETLVTDEVPGTGETPKTDEVPGTGETPKTDEVPGTDETSKTEEATGTDETPKTDEVPETDETLKMDEVPGTDETPKTDEVPAADEEAVPEKREVVENLLKAGSVSVTDENVTENQPFAPGAAGSRLFRIPALITLQNGDLLAAADARWTTNLDWGGLDTIASVSSDGGKTWQYSFPIFFPDSNTVWPGSQVATTAIDPIIVQGADGTIYCMADMNPSGITTGDIMPGYGTGFVEIEGKWRLPLTATYTKPTASDTNSYGDPANYEYYVGDFDENGFAPVLNKSDNTPTQWGVDEWYNIYTVNEAGEYEATLTQTMVNSDTVIQQNAFYKDSVLHVYNTGYIWMVTSKDNGRTWGDPQILNTQIKRDSDRAILISPGQGLQASCGDIIIPVYDHGDGQENTSIIWSSDKGATWHRSNDVGGMWSSESEVVELSENVLRVFYRNGNNYVCYADITKENDTWTIGNGVRTSVSAWSSCNVTAIRYSEEIDGKIAVMVGCPGGGGRVQGRIFTFLINKNDFSDMTLYNTFAVNEGAYAYSCMTETKDGDIALLWEHQGAAIRFDVFSRDEILGYEKNITVDMGAKYIEETAADTAKEITTAPDSAIATAKSELVVEESKVVLHDHQSNTASSLSSFAENAGTATVNEAEFTFTKNGENWRIYNETEEVYLTNASVATTFFSEAAGDMKVEAIDGEFRICKSSGDRYIIFFNTNMDFNSNRAYNASFTAGSYELVLLEKQDKVSADDVVPGYKRVSEITSGNKYLISYLWGTDTETTEDDAVIVLYPTNGTAAQTKLVGDMVDVKKNVVTIEGITPGETTAVIGDVLYNITVTDPRLSPAYDGKDIPASELTATAGDEHATTGSEGPASNVLDNNTSTIWHTNYTSQGSDKYWIQFAVPEGHRVDGLRYLPRQNGSNGTITKYEIKVSNDGSEWETVATGTWEDNVSWKRVSFDAQETKYVRLVAIETAGTTANEWVSAAEIRLTETQEEPPVPVNKDALDAAITVAESKKAEDYTAESYAELAKALEAAKAVKNNADATQAEVDEAVKTLNDAVTALKPKEETVTVDKAALEKAIAAAEAKNAKDYTTESYAALTKALDKAKTVKNNAAATQTEVDEAVRALNDAVKALKPNKETTDKPSKPSKPETVKPNQSGNNSQTGSSQQKGQTTQSAPKTGDFADTAVWFAAILFAAAVVWEIEKKKRNKI